MIQRLEHTAKGEAFQQEVSRRTRLAESLESIRKHTAARRVRIPAAGDARDRTVRNLTADIELRPGELRIQFSRAEDLAAKLFELSQAMANDWEAFVANVEAGYASDE